MGDQGRVGIPGFVPNVLTMLSGSSAALAIALLATPWLTRLYSPEDFGVMAVYMSVVSIGAIAATWRYELAIHMPKHHGMGRTLTVLAIVMSICFALVVSIVSSVVLLSAPTLFSERQSPIFWSLAVPTGIAAVSAVQALTYWQTRHRQFHAVALNRAGQALGMTGSQVALGYAAVGAAGLVVGHLVGAFTFIVRLLRHSAGRLALHWRRITMARLRLAASRYHRFPKLVLPGHLANTVSGQMPVLLLTAFYGPREAGLYAVAERLTAIPTGVVMNSVGEVFRPAAAEAYATKGNCRDIFVSTKRRLVIMALPISVTIGVAAPVAFPVVLGDEWREAGVIAVSLAFLIFFQSVSSPLSQTVMLAGRHVQDLIWQIFRLVVSIGCISIVAIAGYGFHVAISAHVAGFVLCYCVHSWLQYRAALGYPKH